MSHTISNREFKTFRQALIISASLHLLLFILAVISPYLPSHTKKGMVHYVNVVSFPGGGGGGSGSGGPPGGPPGGGTQSEAVGETELPERENLSDLTVPNKAEQQESSLRYPVDKPKKEKKADTKKKTVIQKSTTTSQPKTKSSESSSGTLGGGTGLRLGVGGGGGGGGVGFGSQYSSQIGMSTFPYTWYLQTLHARISNNWYTSRISTGLSGDYFTTISFRIYKDGHISEPEIVESSDVKSLDLSAIRAVRSSAPFPPLPTEYKEEYLLIRLIFEHTK
ncbi:MAG: energy transducer TonB [Candidatus Aminicenantes bacterium]